MAIEVNLIQGNNARLTQNGWENVSMVAIVTGVAGNGDEKVFNAYLELVAYGVDIGDAHPTITTAILTSIELVSETSEDIRLLLSYVETRLAATETVIGATLTQEQTNLNAAGNDITVTYTYPENHPVPELAGRTETVSKLIDKQIANVAMTLTKSVTTINGSPVTADSIITFAKFFVGKINTDNWDLRPDDDKKTWLCTGITGVSRNGGMTYDMDFSFEHRSDTWDTTVLFIDPSNNNPPSDLVDNEGKKTVQVYVATDFSDMGLA